ncbi:hypothetical protein GGE65_008059 [Skermanella aerolata]|uniref:hypothetical protein n=1 Tax=Skermanella aerolata TaxID=393310 RepID=UPI003D22E124
MFYLLSLIRELFHRLLVLAQHVHKAGTFGFTLPSFFHQFPLEAFSLSLEPVAFLSEIPLFNLKHG